MVESIVFVILHMTVWGSERWSNFPIFCVTPDSHMMEDGTAFGSNYAHVDNDK